MTSFLFFLFSSLLSLHVFGNNLCFQGCLKVHFQPHWCEGALSHALSFWIIKFINCKKYYLIVKIFSNCVDIYRLEKKFLINKNIYKLGNIFFKKIVIYDINEPNNCKKA